MLKSRRITRYHLDRERIRVCLTGLLSLATIVVLVLLAACAKCPTASGCPRIPFGYQP